MDAGQPDGRREQWEVVPWELQWDVEVPGGEEVEAGEDRAEGGGDELLGEVKCGHGDVAEGQQGSAAEGGPGVLPGMGAGEEREVLAAGAGPGEALVQQVAGTVAAPASAAAVGASVGAAVAAAANAAAAAASASPALLIDIQQRDSHELSFGTNEQVQQQQQQQHEPTSAASSPTFSRPSLPSAPASPSPATSPVRTPAQQRHTPLPPFPTSAPPAAASPPAHPTQATPPTSAPTTITTADTTATATAARVAAVGEAVAVWVAEAPAGPAITVRSRTPSTSSAPGVTSPAAPPAVGPPFETGWRALDLRPPLGVPSATGVAAAPAAAAAAAAIAAAASDVNAASTSVRTAGARTCEPGSPTAGAAADWQASELYRGAGGAGVTMGPGGGVSDAPPPPTHAHPPGVGNQQGRSPTKRRSAGGAQQQAGQGAGVAAGARVGAGAGVGAGTLPGSPGGSSSVVVGGGGGQAAIMRELDRLLRMIEVEVGEVGAALAHVGMR